MQMAQIERAGVPAEARRSRRNEMQGIRLWLPRPHPESKIEARAGRDFPSSVVFSVHIASRRNWSTGESTGAISSERNCAMPWSDIGSLMRLLCDDDRRSTMSRQSRAKSDRSAKAHRMPYRRISGASDASTPGYFSAGVGRSHAPVSGFPAMLTFWRFFDVFGLLPH